MRTARDLQRFTDVPFIVQQRAIQLTSLWTSGGCIRQVGVNGSLPGLDKEVLSALQRPQRRWRVAKSVRTLFNCPEHHS